MTAMPQNDAIREQAIEWMLRLDEGGLAADERAAFERWQDDPACSKMVAQLIHAARAFDMPGRMGLKLDDLLRSADQHSVNRRALIKGAGTGMLGILLVSWVGLHGMGQIRRPGSLRTAVGKRTIVKLADRSALTLNADTAADVRITVAERRIFLREGRVLAHVAPDVTRPFIVETPFGSVRALGTVFQVTLGKDNAWAEVVVVESKVEVATASGLSRVVSAGERVRFDGKSIGETKTMRRSETGWTRGVYVADDTPLAEVVDNLRPYLHGIVRVDPAAAIARSASRSGV